MTELLVGIGNKINNNTNLSTYGPDLFDEYRKWCNFPIFAMTAKIFLIFAGWCSGTAAHFPSRRLGVQIQSEAGSSGHQAVIGRGSH